MSEFSITSLDFKEGEEIPKKFGYKFENKEPELDFDNIPEDTETLALIMDDPDAMEAVGKVWVHWLAFGSIDMFSKFPNTNLRREGKSDFGEIGYGGPAPPNGRHTYIFKVYALDTTLDLKEGYSKQDLEQAMHGHILAEAKLTGTFTP
jgi:Raf kinase inhibitor-like YbhB/YbcL family protein